jgi:hypothetical protein
MIVEFPEKTASALDANEDTLELVRSILDWNFTEVEP